MAARTLCSCRAAGDRTEGPADAGEEVSDATVMASRIYGTCGRFLRGSGASPTSDTIHDFPVKKQDVDAQHKAGHDSALHTLGESGKHSSSPVQEPSTGGHYRRPPRRGRRPSRPGATCWRGVGLISPTCG